MESHTRSDVAPIGDYPTWDSRKPHGYRQCLVLSMKASLVVYLTIKPSKANFHRLSEEMGKDTLDVDAELIGAASRSQRKHREILLRKTGGL